MIGSPFLHKVIPITVDEPNMNFSCTINGRRISNPLYYFSSYKHKKLVPQSNSTLSLAELFKMERCIAQAEMHKESALSEISSKLEKDCTSESPNAFWTKEKYFVSLPFNPQKNQKLKNPLLPLCLPQKENSVQMKSKNSWRKALQNLLRALGHVEHLLSINTLR